MILDDLFPDMRDQSPSLAATIGFLAVVVTVLYRNWDRLIEIINETEAEP